MKAEQSAAAEVKAERPAAKVNLSEAPWRTSQPSTAAKVQAEPSAEKRKQSAAKAKVEQSAAAEVAKAEPSAAEVNAEPSAAAEVKAEQLQCGTELSAAEREAEPLVDAVVDTTPASHIQEGDRVYAARKAEGASDAEAMHAGYMKMEELAARTFGTRWQDRGPAAPADPSETWRGQRYRPGSNRWSNRGGTASAAQREWHRSGAASSSKPKGAWQKFFDNEGPRPQVLRDAPKWALEKLRNRGENV